MIRGRLVRILLVCTILASAAPVWAAGATIEDVQPGLAGTLRVGYWAPVRVRIAAGDQPLEGRLELVAPDGDGLPTRFGAGKQLELINVPAGETTELVRYVKIGRQRGQITAKLLVDGNVLAERSVSLANARVLPSIQKWIVRYGAPIELEDVVRPRRASDPVTTAESDVNVAADLPDRWYGYSGVDTLLLTTSDAKPIEALNPQQVTALEEWVRMGGMLILSAGAEAPRLATEASPLARFFPGKVVRVSEQVAAGLETFARADQPLGPIALAELTGVEGRVEAYMEGRASGQLPAIVRTPLGFGQVVFLAFDINQPPFREWPATAQLLRNVLKPRPSLTDAAPQENGTRRVSHYGYEELVGQLRSALDHFPAQQGNTGVRLVSFFAVAALLVTYLACITAGDYFLLQRVLRRMALTWVTFPLIVGLFVLAIFLLGRYWRGESRVRLNQVDLVDIDLANGTVRGTTYAHLYSPTTAAYEIGLAARLPLGASPEGVTADAALLSWQGLPGNGLGGFDMTLARPTPTEPYLIRSDAAGPPNAYIYELPIAVGSTKSLLGQWWRFEPLEVPYVLTAGSDGLLSGDLRNPLDVELEEVVLAYDRWAYRLETPLEPRAVLRVASLQRRDLEWRLTQRRVMHSKTSYSTTPWEPESRDVARILEIMMFHDAAGGAAYTKLTQNYQSQLDLSEHLLLQRAVLWGRAKSAAAELHAGEKSLTDTADRKWTWYRLVFPVQRTTDAVPSEETPR